MSWEKESADGLDALLAAARTVKRRPGTSRAQILFLLVLTEPQGRLAGLLAMAAERILDAEKGAPS